MNRERYPIQDGSSVPWEFMAPHEAQARKNHGQTLEGLASRGGLGCAEAWVIVHGLKHRDILHEKHKLKWIELAERVNREWSIERLLAAERERVRERCAGEVVKTWCKFRDAKRKPMVRDLLSNLEQAILQLDLTAPSSTEEGGDS